MSSSSDPAFPDEINNEMDNTVTIQEFLDGVEEEELEADLVLGGDEGKECTYHKGYMKRQAVFSCLTCIPDGNAAVCTACSLVCHDGHEIIELWTKRKLRCDCGNSKFGVFFCKLFANKDPENLENAYNQNFKGSYCICSRPYPDPDAEEQVEMIQCCMCEDWFHENHLGLESLDEIPRNEEEESSYEDFICQACANICSFLTLYPPSIWAQVKKADIPESSVKTENGLVTSESSKTESVPHIASEIISYGKSMFVGESSGTSTGLKEEEQGTTLSGKCIIGVDLRSASLVSDQKKPMFLSKSWRECLCRCDMCREFYTQKGIAFLIDQEDSILEYEKMAKQKRQEKLQSEEGAEMKFLDNLGHVGKMEILRGVADMKDELLSFMENFDSSKPITSDDVKQMFENLAKKRQRLL